ncbi:TPA: CRISPR-associated endoribonuclease Cas6 [Clostridium botulinum]|nr:CRISPR-associated endoribonuclease Cas6 [Clostridium sporogenes]HBJ2613101.1 CRISPR-associated endoribonuclease Cas6 [Clostridium botulinum]
MRTIIFFSTVIDMLSYYELLLEIKLNKDIHFSRSYEMLSKFFNRVMLPDNYLKTLHKKKGVKLYSFSGLYPAATNQIYKRNTLYKIRIRSFDPEFICAMQFSLSQMQDNNINIISIKFIKNQQQFITELVSINPVIFSIWEKQNYWQIGDNIDLLGKQLTNNLLHKYNTIFCNKLTTQDTIFHCLNITNNKTIYIPYKKGLLLGNKLKIQVKEDDISQTLATVALGAGIGEKNSIGMGFCYGH